MLIELHRYRKCLVCTGAVAQLINSLTSKCENLLYIPTTHMKGQCGVSKMAQHVKTLTAKSHRLSLVPRT